MVKVFTNGTMENVMKEVLKMVLCMALESCIIKMVKSYTVEISHMERKVGMACSELLTEHTKGILTMIY